MNEKEPQYHQFIKIGMQGLALTITASALVLLFTSSDQTFHLLRQNIKPSHLPLLALPIFISWVCNGTRFWLMSRCINTPLSYRRSLAIAIASEFGIAASPGGVGGTAVRLSFLKKSGISFSDGGALLAADIFLDMLFFSLLTPFALITLFRQLPAEHIWQLNAPSPNFLYILILPLFLYLNRNRIHLELKKRPFYQHYRLAARLRLWKQNLIESFNKGKTAATRIFSEHRGHLCLNLLLTALQFCSRYSVLPIAIWLLGSHLNPLPLIFIQGLLYLIGMLVIAPGGGGSIEILAAIILPRFISVELTGVTILLWRFFTYHFYLLIGGTIFSITFRKLFPNR
tara:strand:+ start:7427 stop:8452 length:1026 start_codon:yes stop_codon:yes gene_type:complete